MSTVHGPMREGERARIDASTDAAPPASTLTWAVGSPIAEPDSLADDAEVTIHGIDAAEVERWGAAGTTAGVGLDDVLAEDYDPPAGRRHLSLTTAADIVVRPVKWVWQDRLPVGEIALIGGREGIGKSLIADGWLAAQVTRGLLPGVFLGESRGVIIVATEDSWAHTIVPRLMAADADLSRVHRVEAVTSDGLGVELALPDDLDHLANAIIETNAGLVVFDPLVSRLDAGLDTHKDAEVRRALEPLRKVAERTQTLFLGLIHVNKSKHTDPLTMLMASRAFTAVPRAVLFLAVDPTTARSGYSDRPRTTSGAATSRP